MPAETPQDESRSSVLHGGIDIIKNGLPPLPDAITHKMMIPISYWTAERSAVVIFLDFSEVPGLGTLPFVTSVPYYMESGEWTVESSGVLGGFEFPFDPVTQPEKASELHGEAAVYGSLKRVQADGKFPFWVAAGRASTQVESIALVQAGVKCQRKLDSYFGSWVVCTETPEPFEVLALDNSGRALASLHHPIRPGVHPDFP